LIELAVNADDFGFTTDVNDGIVAAHRNGILTSTTLMANGAAFDHAVALARKTPTLDIGCHLTLVGGPALTGGMLPGGVPELLWAIARGKIPLYDELAAQVRKIQDAGLRPTHLDTHKHTHVAPPVLRALSRVAREFQIPWVRRPFDFIRSPRSTFLTRMANKAMRSQAGYFARQFEGLRSTNYFIGFTLTGRLDARVMAEEIRRLPEGFTEFMVHPGYLREDLRRAHTRLKESRERELEALCSDEVKRAIAERAVVLRGFEEPGK